MNATTLRKRIRIGLFVVIFGLVISGVTAFPLLWEMNLLSNFLTQSSGDLNPLNYSGFTHWVLKVREGLDNTYQAYSFIGYGTDWLAFGHIVISLFFTLPVQDPIRYSGVIKIGMISCILVIPLALICGEIRGIPRAWRIIDCLFGLLCLPILIWLHFNISQLEKLAHSHENNESD